MRRPDPLSALFADAPAEQAARAFDFLLVGLAARGGADRLDARGRARLSEIYVAAGADPRAPFAQAAPRLAAYLEGLDVDPNLLRRMEAALVGDVERGHAARRRASRGLIGAPAPRLERACAPAAGSVPVHTLAPPRRLR